MNNKKKCFVIMPISGTQSCTEDEWTGIYECMIKPAVTGSRLGFDCERARPRTGAFIKDILEGLNRADVVIADLTDRNPNVCYELGIRHTLKNRTILTAQNIDDVPSDLQSYWVVTYKKDLTGASEFKKKVREILREMQKAPDKTDSPVADFLRLKNIDILAYEKATNLKKLGALISELSYNISIADSVIKRRQENKEAREKGRKDQVAYSSRRFSNSCLNLLLSTSYIMLPEKWLRLIREHNSGIDMLNITLTLWPEDAFTEQVEEKIEQLLPKIRDTWVQLMQLLSRLNSDYANENYIEPEVPIICLFKQEHEQYLKLVK